MILNSKTKQVWPAFNFTIEVGRNVISELPEEGREQIKKRIKQLVAAGLATVEKPEKPEKSDGSGDVQNPVSGVSAD